MCTKCISILDKIVIFSKQIEKRCLNSGDFVFHQGEKGNHLYAVIKGRVKLVRYTVEGREVVLHTANYGETFAEAAIFSDKYHCSAIATKPSEIKCYPKKLLLDIFRKEPEKAAMFMAQLASQVKRLRTALELRNVLSAKERIHQYLLIAASPESQEITIDCTFKDVAAELGLAHETFYRELAKLEKENLIKRDGNKITVL